ncbi:2-oxoisovalerate dehydrogenase E2 component (dihydrolipoyl transacylase) [Paenibacillus cellulosilyticus]|uniref:Dihydrolipoamide acetyltransferase component of pyruvate dehydrogenase complex n=1 Tax=Paenibacillus cellulosilyticus TaxID=375489 RepID=A0A2V2YYW1_9BACL|nr:dihydrolipoamide acetyltransferase family protein [Paenibacillus cellulosilyticus]PWW05634.1 2-oxoisovalerate dehydrogenase E2 component (dihydrolipoyl transacylase) [Paenibacillus cellulosilyticus]QKS45337.1 2-oxo acid dehydrogenase subunit E2 [Paenibacillus cellulosilyticus]
MKTLTEIVMPKLAESLVSATIDRWLKQPGDTISMYEPICEVITNKVNAEIPSTVEGRLVSILAKDGEDVPVGAPICVIEAIDESAGAGSTAPVTSAASTQPAAGEESDIPVEGDMRGRYSPAVQRIAAEHGVDLQLVRGTGLGGRVTRKDVLAYAASGQPKATVAAEAVKDATVKTEKAPLRTTGLHLSETPRIPQIEVESEIPGRGEYFIDITPIRNAIARNVKQSVTEIPHAWMMIEVDVTNLVQLRNKLKDEFKKREGVNLTYLAFVLKAVVNAVKDYPIINSTWATDKIIVKRDINISLAVGTEDSVATPVIKNADQKNIAGIAHEIDDLARRGREGKLTLSDMSGGTLTVNNTGSFGSILSYPTIVYPQAVNLTFESIVKRPVVINDMIGVRSMANMCLSLDHRILDGVICGRFLQRVKENLESFSIDTKLY